LDHSFESVKGKRFEKVDSEIAGVAELDSKLERVYSVGNHLKELWKNVLHMCPNCKRKFKSCGVLKHAKVCEKNFKEINITNLEFNNFEDWKKNKEKVRKMLSVDKIINTIPINRTNYLQFS